MKLWALYRGNLVFQFKYGFYYMYALFIVMYAVLLSLLPADWRPFAGMLIIISDPAIVGLIFMGALIHLERAEGTFAAMVVAPVSPASYLWARLLGMGTLGTIIGLILAAIVGRELSWMFIPGLGAGVVMFAAIGVVLALKTNSLNQFVLLLIPVFLFVLAPAGLYFLPQGFDCLGLHPAVALLMVMDPVQVQPWALVVLLFWMSLAVLVAYRQLRSHFHCGKIVP
jgi:fluoroquinolone transport system permease protein